MSTADRDDLDAILAKHQQSRSAWKAMVWHVICTCDDYIPVRPGAKDEDVHRAHVAQMVLESDWLRGVRADELRDAAAECRVIRGVEAEWADRWLRDRADRVDAEDTDNTTDRT